ncbi:beta-glucoside-specific PTS transporter subunit IIABC [Liquorilactobacillus capillatus]|uniref:PTS system sucrose-specific EIIBCA component n=1 Tax=Liquorilactobacillus capillatus DSM 19910 TaxID=1423731 RepID=A0A0R1M5J2_9LACO|nr:beta-glucoside-specific PTS transporter subunit IIABC [Liquorilactobacillus capillatus]KRL00836.1 PTD system beta-glucoside-specific transporter subunit EIIBCA [Liquorilactobacillus capillatus DSM 19910]
MDYEKLATDIVKNIGGKENINTAWHCATRLRFKLKDESKAKTAEIENLDGVITVVQSAGQYQVVVGNAVANVFEAIARQTGLDNEEQKTQPQEKETNLVNRFIAFISGTFTPFLGAMAGAGILKGLLALFVALNWMSATSGTYEILYAAGDSLFNFLPIFLAFTAAKRLNVNQYVAVALAASLVYPTLVATATKAQTLHFIGIPVVPTTYTSSVIPILLAVWILSFIEPVLNNIFPEAVRNIFTPLFSLAIMVPLTMIVVGPLGSSVGNVLSTMVTSIYNFAPALAGAIMGAFWQVFVIFGVHWTFVPVMMNNLGKMGYDPLLPILCAAVISQAGAALGIFLKTKDKKQKALAGSGVITGIFGITEPIIYGLTLKLKRPFIYAVISGGIGGAIIGGFQVRASSFTLPSLLAIPTYLGKGFIGSIIGIAVSFVLGAVLTYFFGLSKSQAVAEEMDGETEKLLAPVQGTLIPLTSVNDEVFASEAMGKGIAIVPTDNKVVSPVSGTISAVYPTGHAIGIISDQGAEILIHIGINTVKLNGKYFETKVKQEQRVDQGDELLAFDPAKIKEAGYDNTVMMIVTNTKQYEVISTQETAAEHNTVLTLQLLK